MSTAPKTTTYLETDSPEGAVRIPVATIEGASDGPTLTVVAGVHGSEYVGIEAAKQLLDWIDPTQLSGMVRVVPCLNIPAFFGLSAHVNPLDGKDLGAAFPGNPGGSHTERLADLLWREVIQGSDYLVDVHGGDLEEELVEYSQVTLTGIDAVDAQAEALARVFDMPMFVRQPRSLQPSATGSLFDMATRSGIPSVLVEAGSHGRLDFEIVAVHFRGLRNVLYHLQMLPGKPTQENPDPLVLHRFLGIAAPADGFWLPAVDKGAVVRAGQVVGELQDFFGNHLATIEAPEDAAVLGVMTIPPRRQGEMLMGIATLA